MRHLISSGRNVFIPIDGSFENPLFEHDTNSNAKKMWIKMLEKEGLCTDSKGVDIGTLFDCVKHAFESEFGCRMDVFFVSQYIAANNGEFAVKHDDASRAFSTGRIVYIDKLMVNVLFEYIANHYLWARFGNEVFSFCFKHTLKILDACCRQGYLDTDEGISELLGHYMDKGDDRAYTFIADLYWCVMAFVMCHELAHIYIDETAEKEGMDITDSKAESLADEYGYRVFLRLIVGSGLQYDSPFLSVFHDYLYAAPMILFLFYEDLYFMENWVYGEKITLKEHSPFSVRKEKLIEFSREWDFDIELSEGDDVLNNFWDISVLFREELVYKIKNGKLTEMIQKGYRNMSNLSGYEQALQYDMQVQSVLKKYADDHNIEQGKMIGLYNIAVKYDVLNGDIADHGLVRSVDGKVVSMKPYNLRFCLAASLSAIIETGITLFWPGEKIPTIMQLIKILITLVNDSTIEISEEQARVLIACHKSNAYAVPIEENEILTTAEASSKTVDELCRLKCIELIDGKIRLIEEVVLN